MAVNTANLLLGPATLYRGSFGATEPADSSAAINATPAASAWTDAGGTTDGVKLIVDQTYTELVVDQIVDRAGSRLTKRDMSVETNMAEATLENLSLLMNGGTAASGSGYKTFEPSFASSATQPNYSALLFDGWGAGSLRRRVIVRKVLNTDSIELAYTKDTQTVLKAKFSAHYVSDVIAPLHIAEATS
ncbi:phage tail tube protein [Kitasatospora sp. NPDC054939]